MWQRDTSGECSDEDEGNVTITSGSTGYDIVGLEEDSSYSITVTATNVAGSSAVSDAVTAMTLEAGEIFGVGHVQQGWQSRGHPSKIQVGGRRCCVE